MNKPTWLNKKIDLGKCREVDHLLKGLRLNTICREAKCPNISECFDRKVATFLILGDVCTRNCNFCSVTKGIPLAIDTDEPLRVSQAVKKLGLKYVVITSVTRDDLLDGGAAGFVNVIAKVKEINSKVKVEVLVPDFKGNEQSIQTVLNSGIEVFGHNIETVKELYSKVRQKADYKQSLDVLAKAKKISPQTYTKTAIMLGLGELKEQVLRTLADLRKVKCDFVNIGQYLTPSKTHYPVYEYIKPEFFNFYKEQAKQMGFLHVESAPYVRSSYMAERAIQSRGGF